MSTTPAGWYPEPRQPGPAALLGRLAVDRAPHPAPAGAAGRGRGRRSPIPTTGTSTSASSPRSSARPGLQHQLTEFPTWAVIVLSIMTLGIFGVIYHGPQALKLPKVRSDDFGAGKGDRVSVHPLLQPLLEVHLLDRLADRINFQYRLRGAPPPVSRDLAIWTNITGIAGAFIFVTWLAWPILACVSAAQIQNAANRLVNGEVDSSDPCR